MVDLFGAPEIEEEEADGSFEVTAAAIAPDEPLTARTTPYALGHEEIERELLALFKSNKFPHALIFSGVQGIGKSVYAYRLARFLLKYGGQANSAQGGMFDDAPVILPDHFDMAQDDPVFRRVVSGGHADLMVVGREMDEKKGKLKGGVDIAQIRKVTPFLRMTSSNGGWRVVIIDDADTMNRNAQNALLKILEEPPEHVCLILVTHRLGALIPTIRSRSRNISFSELESRDIERLLELYNVDKPGAEDMALLLALARGSFGQAVNFLEEGGIEDLQDILEVLQDAPNWKWSALHKLGDKLSGNHHERNFKNFSFMLPWIFSESARRAAGLSSALPAEILPGIGAQKALEIYDALKEHFEMFERGNLDKRQAVLGAFGLIS